MNFQKKNPLIILIGGRARSGKSSLALYLKQEYQNQSKKVIMSPYTKYLKQYITEVTEKPIDDDNKPRDLLQQISSKIIKKELNNKDFFIRRQIEDLEVYSYFADVILIADVRFPEEIKRIKDHFSNVVSIGVVRENYISILTEEQQQDITETALDNYHDYDFQVINNEIEDLKIIAQEIIQKIEERRYVNE